MGLRGQCRLCERERQRQLHAENPDGQRRRTLRYRYGIDQEQYDAILEQQDHRCAICRTADLEVRNGQGERYALHIDHDHETGRIRGLLCFRCNNGIGLLPHSEVLRAAANYLEGGQ